MQVFLSRGGNDHHLVFYYTNKGINIHLSQFVIIQTLVEFMWWSFST